MRSGTLRGVLRQLLLIVAVFVRQCEIVLYCLRDATLLLLVLLLLHGAAAQHLQETEGAWQLLLLLLLSGCREQRGSRC